MPTTQVKDEPATLPPHPRKDLPRTLDRINAWRTESNLNERGYERHLDGMGNDAIEILSELEQAVSDSMTREIAGDPAMALQVREALIASEAIVAIRTWQAKRVLAINSPKVTND